MTGPPLNLPFYTTRKKRRSNPEVRLQIVVGQHLDLAGVPGLMWFHIPNGLGKFSPATAALGKRMGVKPGVSDLFIGVPGQMPGFLELKSRGNKPTEVQWKFGEHCAVIGYWWEWADNFDDAIRILKKRGALKAEARAA